MATSLPEIYDAYRADAAFDHLRSKDIILVPGEGSPRPRIFIVGEAPGATENLRKRPFVGASGQALRSLIGDVARLDPVDYFITNTVKYRPPNNRTPTEEEIKASMTYLRQEYAAVGSPPVLVAVGGAAFYALRPRPFSTGILAEAGESIQLKGGAALWPMAHPAYGLRNKSYRPTMEKHWEKFGDWFREEFA